MKKNILNLGIIALVIVLFASAFGLFKVYGFGDDVATKELRFQSGNGDPLDPNGNKAITKCTYPIFYIRVWNDPIDRALSNVRTEVVLPRILDNTLGYSASSTNYATKTDGSVINETDVDQLGWNQAMAGNEMLYRPGSMYYNYKTQAGVHFEPTIQYFTDSNGKQAQKLVISGLPNLAENESVGVFWFMKTGGNCITVEKLLTSNSGTVYNTGDKVTYELTLKNTGSYPYQNLAVSDTFDSNTFSNNVLVESLDGRTVSNVNVSGSTLTFNLSDQLLKDASTKVKLTFTVKPNFVGTHACNISGFVTYKDLQNLFNNRSNFTSPSSLCVNLFNPNPKINVIKSLQNFDKEGNKVTFKIDVKNEGDVAFVNALVTDTYDSSKLALVSIKEGLNNVSVITTTNPNDLQFLVEGSLNANSTRSFLLTFNVKPEVTTGKVCNLNVLVKVKSGETILSDSFDQDICVDYTKLTPGVKVVKYLVNSSTAMLEYKIDITNTGNTDLKTLMLTDTYDDSRLLLNSIVPVQNSNEAGKIVINNVLQGSDTLVPNETVSVKVKFNVKSNAPTGLACNKSVDIEAKDNAMRVVSANYVVPQDTTNCVNLIVLVEKEPYFSISKRLSSKTDTLVGDMAQWEIIVRNICNGDACKPATFLEFKDAFPETKLTFNSAFAQLKNADGTNVNPNPIQFNPTSITSENGLTVIRYSDITDLVGDITSGQYVVFSINTTTKASSGSCVLNTATAIGSTNSVSASACVNIGEVLGTTTVVTTNLPKTDILDLFNTIVALPSNIQAALLLMLLGISFGVFIPAALIRESKKVE